MSRGLDEVHVGLRRCAVIAGLTLCLGTTACGTKSTAGSGHVVARRIPVAAFSRVEVATAFDVRVSVGAAERVVVHVDDNLARDLDVGVSGNTLHIRLKPGASVSNATLKADVTVRTLAGIAASGASKIALVDEIRAPTLSATLSGASRLDGRVTTPDGRIDLSGAARAGLSGSARRLHVTESGASSLDARGLMARSLTIDLSGASMASVRVTDSMSAGLSGASSLRYRGSPRVIRREVSGGSSIAHL